MPLDAACHLVSEDPRVVERYHRINANHSGYEGTVTDPKIYTAKY